MSNLSYLLKEAIVLSCLWKDQAFCHLGHSHSYVKFQTQSFILITDNRTTSQNSSVLGTSVLFCLVGNQPPPPPIELLYACLFGGRNLVLFLSSFKFANWEYQSHTMTYAAVPVFLHTWVHCSIECLKGSENLLQPSNCKFLCKAFGLWNSMAKLRNWISHGEWQHIRISL